MNRLVEILIGNDADANQSSFEQEIEVHEPNAVHVHTVRLIPMKVQTIDRKRLVERRRRRTNRRS